jgi:hypothetical protein
LDDADGSAEPNTWAWELTWEHAGEPSEREREFQGGPARSRRPAEEEDKVLVVDLFLDGRD